MFRLNASLASYLLLISLALTLGGCLEPFSADGTTPTKTKRGASEPTAAGAAGAKGKHADKKKKVKQTYAQAWQLICNAERLSGADPRDDRDVRSSKVAEWINQHVKNNKARYWWIGYAKVRQSEREVYFRGEAKDAGQATCPLASLLFPKPPATSRPATQPSKAPPLP